jgi:hypothetical protein
MTKFQLIVLGMVVFALGALIVAAAPYFHPNLIDTAIAVGTPLVAVMIGTIIAIRSGRQQR